MKWRLALALALVLAGCRTEMPLPVYWHIPPFQLTSQAGQPFDSKSLAGHVWVADFVYTTCPGPCPRMSAQMRGVQTAVASLPGVRLVSFTVDPKTDTAAVLAKYAERYQAQPGRWYFLTGAQADLQSLCRNGFKLGDVDGTMVHSTRFVLIDGKGFVRGFYNPADDDAAMPKLLHDIKTLAAQT